MNDWYEAEQRVEKAQQLAESRQWVEALAEIDAALAINSTNGTWQAHRGYLLDQLERFEDAVAAYRASIDLEPGDVDVMLALGVDLTRLGNCADAVDVLENAETLAPDREAVYCYRILSYSELGEHDRAEEMFYLAQQIEEDCPNCFFHMGGSLAARGQFERAIYCWSRTLDIDPTYPAVRHCIAQAYRDQGNIDRAREYFLAEIRQDPGNVDLLFDMAELEEQAGNFGKAAAKFRQIVELDPEYGQAFFALAEVLLEIGEPTEALEALRTAAELEPELPRLNLRMGQALAQLAEHAEAIRYLAMAHQSGGDDDAVLVAWGNCLVRLGCVAEAADKFRRLLSIDAESAIAHHNLAVCQFLLGSYDEGLEHILRAIELNPDDILAMHKAILVLMHVHRWAEARAMIERALALDGEDAALIELRDRFWRHRLRAILARFLPVRAGWDSIRSGLDTVMTRLRK